MISAIFVGGSYYLGVMSVKKANEAISAKQSSHNRLTSRVGGLVAIMALVIVVCFTADQLIFFIVLSSIPVFVAGGLEDLGYNIKPAYRFSLGMVSGFIAIYLTGLWLNNVDLTILTPILSFPYFAICFTAFASTGISNSINLIDGVNGLASGVITLIGSALCIISFLVGDVGLGTFCIILVGSILGFFIWNFPKGLIFLGDAGAYTYGHLLVWIAISLITKYPDISAWAIFCLFFWPIMDTVAAIFRRNHPINPIGTTVVEADDEVFFIAAKKNIRAVMAELRRVDKPSKRVMIAGGGNIGARLAEAIDGEYRVKVIERSHSRCRELSEQLKHAIVLNGNASDTELLAAESIEKTDVF